MAERFPRDARPTLDVQVQQFAKELYNYLWIKFKVAVPETVQTLSPQENSIFTEAIGIGVLCEQLLMRPVLLREIFVTWALVIASNPDFIDLLCLAVHKNGIIWSYSKRFFRCCALISEFFLFRSYLVDVSIFNKAERAFQVVFDKFFRYGWKDCGGWGVLDAFAKERINPIYDGFEYYVDNITDPLDNYPPVIERLPVDYEIYTRVGSIHMEVLLVFHRLYKMFVAWNAEQAMNVLNNLSFFEDENSLVPEPMVRPISPIESTSTDTTSNRIAAVQSSGFGDIIPSPTFSPIAKPMQSSSSSHEPDSTPIYKPKPHKSSEGSPPETVSDAESTVDVLSLHKPSSLTMDVTEELPQNPSRKRTRSPENMDVDDSSKKFKN